MGDDSEKTEHDRALNVGSRKRQQDDVGKYLESRIRIAAYTTSKRPPCVKSIGVKTVADWYVRTRITYIR